MIPFRPVESDSRCTRIGTNTLEIIQSAIKESKHIAFRSLKIAVSLHFILQSVDRVQGRPFHISFSSLFLTLFQYIVYL